jgi:hypothetical protein
MKIRNRYLFLIVIIIVFPFFYHQYGWRWNPWASTRLVWDEPNPELIGQSFSITSSAIYRTMIESQPIPVRKMGIANQISLDKNQIISNKPDGVFVRIQPTDVFTIEKTYSTQLTEWKKMSRSERKIAIIKNTDNLKFTFNFPDFEGTNRPDFSKIEDAELNASPWNFKNAEIAYEN